MIKLLLMIHYSLFIDELGESFPKRYRKSPFFILSGCSINQDNRSKLSSHLDQIKFKYWDRTNIVFRSYEIGRKEKDYTIFKNNPSLFNQFARNIKRCLLAAVNSSEYGIAAGG